MKGTNIRKAHAYAAADSNSFVCGFRVRTSAASHTAAADRAAHGAVSETGRKDAA